MFSIKLTISGAFLVAAMLTPISALAGNGGGLLAMPEEAVQNQQGMGHFHQGYYKLIPQGRKSAAGRQMDLAEQAFLSAIEINPGGCGLAMMSR
jgi:hypothetical protein